ncbi:MAG: HRDC domain-containing protein [Nitrospirae bacterium]|nr:HRDC domain-containing protein [Nitrospirota bacterium]
MIDNPSEISPLRINSGSGLAAFLDRISGCASIAVDMESNGFHRYRERVCLVQIAARGIVALVDTIAIADVSALGAIFADPKIEKIMHSTDYDLRSFDRDYGFRFRNIFDTSIAASFAGSRMLGLGTILLEYLGVEIAKSKRLQRHDWSARPISEEAVRYAALDVLHLHALRDVLAGRLNELGRMAWVREECDRLEAIRYCPPEPPETAFLSAKGVRALKPRERAVFRELYLLREREASDVDRPPFKVFSSGLMMQLAQNPEAEITEFDGIPSSRRQRLLAEIREAVRRGIEASPVLYNGKPENFRGRMEPSASALLAKMKDWRTNKGVELGIDPALVWPAKSLEELAGGCNGNGTPGTETHVELQKNGIPLVRNWQREQFGESLRELLGSAVPETVR